MLKLVSPGTKSVKPLALPDDLSTSGLPTNPFQPVQLGPVTRFDDIDSVQSYKEYRQLIAGAERALPKSTIVRTTSLAASPAK